MEFRFNKIDTDIRRKMQEEIQDHKVHGNKSVTIKKDIKEDDNKFEKEKEKEKEKDKDNLLTKKIYTINAIKDTKEKVEIEAEKIPSLEKENYKGITVDTKK